MKDLDLLAGLPVDRAHGGGGATLSETATTFAELGRSGVPPSQLFAIGAQLWSVTMVIARFGSEGQQATWLPSLCGGGAIGAHAMTEPDTGSDAFAVSTTAVARRDGFVLNGVKTFVTNGPEADVFLVFATADRALGWAGISAFVVERTAPGLTVGPPMRTMGTAGAALAEVTFTDCAVPAAAALEPRGTGLSVFTWAMELERSLLPAGLLGVVANRLDAIASRRPGRVPKERLAALWIRRELAWALVLRATAALDAAHKAPRESSLAKLAASELWRDTAALAVDTSGAWGMLAGAEDDLADAVAACIYSGTSEIQREVLARRLKLPA